MDVVLLQDEACTASVARCVVNMALAADNDEEATARLMAPAARGDGDGLWAEIAVRIREVKNEIEAQNNDVHRIDPN